MAPQVPIDLLGPSPVTLFSAALPLDTGIYDLPNLTLGVTSGGSWLADYQFALTVTGVPGGGPVTGVPEPATLALLGLGLAGLVFTQRRRNS